MRESETTSALSILVDGWACRCTTNGRGARLISTVLIPGDLCNLDSLLLDRPGYDVRTLTDASIVTLSRRAASELATLHAGIARTFTWLAVTENATLAQRTISLGRRTSKERLAHLLCELSVRLGADRGGSSTFSHPLRQDHLADILGLTAVHVNRMLRELREEGLFTVEDRTVTLPDVASLRRLCGFDADYLQGERAA